MCFPPPVRLIKRILASVADDELRIGADQLSPNRAHATGVNLGGDNDHAVDIFFTRGAGNQPDLIFRVYDSLLKNSSGCAGDAERDERALVVKGLAQVINSNFMKLL